MAGRCFDRLPQPAIADAIVVLGCRGPAALKRRLEIGIRLFENDHVIYNRATGALLYDSDGIGGHAAVQLATLINKPVLAANDFVVI